MITEAELSTINKCVLDTPIECVDSAEKRYMAEIDELVSTLCGGEKKIILLSGPSGSGKTTTANILKDKLSLLGHETHVVSMDNFYRTLDDPLYPVDENGEHDYEAAAALRCDLIHDCIEALLDGKVYKIPRYNFRGGIIEPEAIPVSLPKNGYIIIEGIHALNPIFTSGLPAEKIMRLFISVSTNINDGGERLLSGRKIRFIRRMTRDSIYRSTSAAGTLMRWQSVLDGEDKYLYPYKSLADFKINTFHTFELAAMKHFAEEAIASSGDEFVGEYAETIKMALKKIEPMDISLVPESSLIREFIPGGVYENLY